MKFTKYLELAKQDPGGSSAEGRRRRLRAVFVCRGRTDNGSSLHPAKPRGVMVYCVAFSLPSLRQSC